MVIIPKHLLYYTRLIYREKTKISRDPSASGNNTHTVGQQVFYDLINLSLHTDSGSITDDSGFQVHQT